MKVCIFYIFWLMAFSVSASGGRASAAPAQICLLYCPVIQTCRLVFSEDGSCSCKCVAFPEFTKSIFDKAGLVDKDRTIILHTSENGITTFIAKPGHNSHPGVNALEPAREVSPHADPQPNETPDQLHERQEREEIIRAAETAANQMRQGR